MFGALLNYLPAITRREIEKLCELAPNYLLVTIRNLPLVILFPVPPSILQRDEVPYKHPDDTLVWTKRGYRFCWLPYMVEFKDGYLLNPRRKLGLASLHLIIRTTCPRLNLLGKPC